MKKDPEFLTYKEAAALLRVSLLTFRNVVKKRKIPHGRVGKKFVFRRSVLERLIPGAP